MEIRRIAGALGAEILGVQLHQDLSAATVGEIRKAFVDHQVIFFRDQTLDPAQFMAFARRMGKPIEYPFVRGIDGFPEVIEVKKLEHERHNFGGIWHSDTSYLEAPPMGSMLLARELPPFGGDTLFANQYAAYDDLPADFKKEIAGLVAMHHYGNRGDLDKASRTVASVLNDEQEGKLTWVKHRVARRHPITGRTALYSVSGSSFGIEGMPEDEARALLDELKDHATQEKYQLRLKYGVGDVVIWDNASLLHSATLIDPNDPRTLWRITIKEERRP